MDAIGPERSTPSLPSPSMSDNAFVFFTGMAGPFSLINGLYDRTSETLGGYPVYVSRSDFFGGLCIVHRNGMWELKPAAQKDSDVAGAYVIGGCPLEKCASRVWKVRGSDDCMIDQPSVKIVLGEEGKRQVRGCCELARTGTPSPNFLYARAGR
jgi:hypothetical protein